MEHCRQLLAWAVEGWGRFCPAKRRLSTKWCSSRLCLSATTRCAECEHLVPFVHHPLLPCHVRADFVASVPAVGAQGRSRMAKSSYDFLFCKAQLKWLFNDYLRPGGRSLLHFSPAEDPRISVTARLRTDIERERLGQNSAGETHRT